jgi:hypothetical protein
MIDELYESYFKRKKNIMNINQKQIVLFAVILLLFSNCRSQTDLLYFSSERIDSIEKIDDWFSISPQGEILNCVPKIELIKDEENNFEGNVLITNQESILIFSSSKGGELSVTRNKIDFNKLIKVGDQIQISENEILYVKLAIIEDDEYLSLEIEDKKQNSKYEIFRNCRVISDINTYFGCGRLPFQIDFIGDIINDEKPELILSANKEGGLLRLIIGFREDKYQVLKWIEF